MKVVTVSTYDIKGGAAKAAYRLHRGIVQGGHAGSMLVRIKNSSDDSVIQAELNDSVSQRIEAFSLHTFIQKRYIDKRRTSRSNTIFSLAYPGYDVSETAVIVDADIINIHWINLFQSITTLKKIFDLGKPIVWTLHDQWAFTGGCHYSAGCQGYYEDCSPCPQLSIDPFNLPAAILKDKIESSRCANLTVVTPSQWLADCARKSSLFRNARIEVIPNSVETDLFYPVDKDAAKKALNISPETRTILFGAETGNESRKGFNELIRAFKQCEFENASKVRLLIFGEPNQELQSLNIPVTSFGYIESQQMLRNVYSAADLFVLPSLEDNLPNTMLESMACGTPVVAFNIGGMPDLIENSRTGLTVTPFDCGELGKAIARFLKENPDSLKSMNRNCSDLIRQYYTQEKQAEKYLSLYEDMLSRTDYRQLKTCGWKPRSSYGKKHTRANLDCSIGLHFSKIYQRIMAEEMNLGSSHTGVLPPAYRLKLGQSSWYIRNKLLSLFKPLSSRRM